MYRELIEKLIEGHSWAKLQAPCSEKDITKAVYKLIKSLVKRDSSFVTMIYGADVSDAQAEKAYEAISAKLGDSVEINLINGGQPVYYYIVSVE